MHLLRATRRQKANRIQLPTSIREPENTFGRGWSSIEGDRTTTLLPFGPWTPQLPQRWLEAEPGTFNLMLYLFQAEFQDELRRSQRHLPSSQSCYLNQLVKLSLDGQLKRWFPNDLPSTRGRTGKVEDPACNHRAICESELTLN